MAKFIETLHPTPFSFWDADPVFQTMADQMITYVKRKAGESTISTELTYKDIWLSFEESVWKFNGFIIEYQLVSNLANLLGVPTGSIDPVTGQSTINLTNQYVVPNLEFLDHLAEPYANIIGFGQTQNTFSGSIALEIGRQDYDLYTELQDDQGNALYSYLSGSGGKMRIHEVYHFAPVQYLFNSSFGSNFSNVGGVGVSVGSFNSDTRFHVLPLFEDILRASMLETAQRTRRSHYNYRISGRNIRIFPTPSSIIPDVNDRVWIRVSYAPNSVGGAFIDLGLTGSNGSISITNEATANGFSAPFYGASNPANVPMGLVNFSSLNQWAKNWIARMTFALAMEIMGRVRRKIQRIPIPGAEVELDGAAIMTEAREDQDKLLAELKDKLESLSYDKLQAMEAEKAANLMKQLALLPFPPAFACKLFE